jgi:tetratricopeptide (TPR) repeat protein
MRSFLSIRNTLCAFAFSAAVFSAANAGAADSSDAIKAADAAEPVFSAVSGIKDPHGGKAVLFFDHTKRFDLNILAEFLKDCSNYEGVKCFCADISGANKKELSSFFSSYETKDCIYKASSTENAPYALFVKEGRPAGLISKDGSFASLTPVYLSYLAGKTDENKLSEMLDAAEKGENYKKIVPRMNFVLMLAKKGETEAAINEMDKVNAAELDDKGKLLLGQTYLRLKAAERAYSVFSACQNSIECVLYSGVAAYLKGDSDKALEILNGIKDRYEDQDKLNYYLKKIYESQGDNAHAEEIRLPENYNTGSE